jgi:hypothetical protein
LANPAIIGKIIINQKELAQEEQMSTFAITLIVHYWHIIAG